MFGLFLLYDFLFSNNQRPLWAELYFIVFGSGCIYQAISHNVLLVDKEKIILKGILGQTSYPITEFREITTKKWAQIFEISFIDCKSFEFISRTNSPCNLFYSFRQEEVIEITRIITAAITENKTDSKVE